MKIELFQTVNDMLKSKFKNNSINADITAYEAVNGDICFKVIFSFRIDGMYKLVTERDKFLSEVDEKLNIITGALPLEIER